MKNLNIPQLLYAVFLISIFPLASHGIDGRFQKRKFGQYKVFLSQEFESGMAKIIVKKGKDKIFEEAEIGNHYYFGHNYDDPDVYSGRDITGNGIPNLLVFNWTGGAHCCHFLHIFELGKNFKKLITIDAGSSPIRFIDLDKDGFPEIEFWGGAIDYQFASFAGSPAGRVVLKFQKDHYEVATQLMKKPMLSEAKMRHLKKKLSGTFPKELGPDLPYGFLEMMMNLSYSGHYKSALKFADEVWPVEKFGLAEFKSEFSQALRNSPYWQDF